MKIEFSEQAASDMEAIADYFRNVDAVSAGERLIQHIYATIDILQQHPHAGRDQDVAGVRKLVIPGTSYIAYYLVDEPVGEIVVLTVRHAARRRSFEDK